MMRTPGILAAAGMMLSAVVCHGAGTDSRPLHFGVINQRSLALTAEFWNPILRYVGQRSGVELRLRMGRTAPETTVMSMRGDHDFVYSNHLFTIDRDRIGFRAIARFRDATIHGVLVVREDSPVRGLAELAGRKVAFASHEAFIDYHVPMRALQASGIAVEPVFSGNPEGALAQLRTGQVPAAGVNLEILEKYASRQPFRYRVLWKSPDYLGIPVMAHPRVPPATVVAVQKALLGMAADPEGRKVLARSAAALRLPVTPDFVVAEDHEYDNYRRFYRTAAGRGGP